MKIKLFRPLPTLIAALLLSPLLTGCIESKIDQCVRLEEFLLQQEKSYPDFWDFPVSLSSLRQGLTREQIDQSSKVYNQSAQDLRTLRFRDKKLQLIQERFVTRFEILSRELQTIITPNTDKNAVETTLQTLFRSYPDLTETRKDLKTYCNSQ